MRDREPKEGMALLGAVMQPSIAGKKADLMETGTHGIMDLVA